MENFSVQGYEPWLIWLGLRKDAHKKREDRAGMEVWAALGMETGLSIAFQNLEFGNCEKEWKLISSFYY